MRSLTVLGLVLMLTGLSAESWAGWSKVSGKDKEDGSQLSGIALTSDDGNARLFFLCDSDKAAPQIMISHKEVIGEAADPFRVTYLIDDRDEQIHWFLAKGSGKTGYFFVRYPIDYEERFGAQPPPFSPGSNAINPDYLAWDRNIYLTVVHDFLTGTVGLIRIRDTKKQNHYYSFILAGMKDYMSELSGCYDTPKPPLQE
ncbi:hypothetical protein [Hwanghaeella sp.]|uniref:hypothetical protein n=1 Tax=Hwanghaeella sp. TaxID=2605943 RepID=UPI003CCC0419